MYLHFVLKGKERGGGLINPGQYLCVQKDYKGSQFMWHIGTAKLRFHISQNRDRAQEASPSTLALSLGAAVRRSAGLCAIVIEAGRPSNVLSARPAMAGAVGSASRAAARLEPRDPQK